MAWRQKEGDKRGTRRGTGKRGENRRKQGGQRQRRAALRQTLEAHVKVVTAVGEKERKKKKTHERRTPDECDSPGTPPGSASRNNGGTDGYNGFDVQPGFSTLFCCNNPDFVVLRGNITGPFQMHLRFVRTFA